MSFFDESIEIIPDSPEVQKKGESRSKRFETKKGKSQWSNYRGSDSENENEIIISDTSGSFATEGSNRSYIPSSDLEDSHVSPNLKSDFRDKETLLMENTPISYSRDVEKVFQNGCKKSVTSSTPSFDPLTPTFEPTTPVAGWGGPSTPTFDPATPVGGWRGPRKISLSDDDESPIAQPNSNRRYCVIDSDESDSEPDEKNNIIEEYDNSYHGKSISNINDNSSHVDNEGKRFSNESSSPTVVEGLTSHKTKSPSLVNNELISHPITPDQSIPDPSISQSLTEPTAEVDSSHKTSTGHTPSYRTSGKFKIKARIKDKGNGDISNKDHQDTSNISVASLSSSISSVKSSSSVSSSISNLSHSEIQARLKSNKMILKTANINVLPDRGEKLKQKISELEEALVHLSMDSIKEDEVSTTKNSSRGSISSFSECNSNNSVEEIEPSIFYSPTETDEEKEDAVTKHLRYLKEELREKQRLYKASNPRALEDGGLKLRDSISRLEREIMMQELKTGLNSKFNEVKPNSTMKPNTIEDSSGQHYTQKQTVVTNSLQLSSMAKAMTGGQKYQQLPQHVIESLYSADKDYGAKDYGGKLSEKHENNMIRMTSDAVEMLHRTLKAMPDVDTAEETPPRGVRVDLMPHQRRALKWLLWREAQINPGGVLADDMGLGKTLTMLSLLLRHKELLSSGEIADDFSALGPRADEPDEDEEWYSKEKGRRKKSKLTPSKGTLVVCPASLLGQWEGEVRRHIRGKRIAVLVYHGKTRDLSIRRLAEFDLVVTTYQLVMREAFSGATVKTSKKNVDSLPEIEAHDQGPLFRIGWTRIILDEAHQIRNHKSKTSQAACMLRGGRRWAVTGTPVQNKELDFYSLVRFLRVSPFEDYTCWKHQLNTSSVHGLRKLNLLVQTLVLRRTKDQVDQITGEALVSLPSKEIVLHKLSLGQEEREVYDRVFAFSRSSLIEYMKSQEEKEREKMERGGQNFQPKSLSVPHFQESKYTPTLTTNILKADELKAHHMLVLLLRLRQICCHPSLIRAIIDDEAKTSDGLDSATAKEDLEIDLITQMNEMSLREGLEKEEVDNRVRDEILNADNPIFKKRTSSSKITKVISELQSLEEGEAGKRYEKSVIVSQWTSMLQIVYKHLKKSNISASAITGQIPVKDRASIVDEFNEEGKGPKVLLLSLAAGGVGLNLVGANHLFLLDMHWNPQLESQACDRIYRVGQKRPVTIHRFVVENTVEEKILELQQKKLDLADAVLTGAKRTLDNKLTLQDLKALFSIN